MSIYEWNDGHETKWLRHHVSMCEKNNEIGTPNETIETWNVHMWTQGWTLNETSETWKFQVSMKQGGPNEANLDKRCLGMCEWNNGHLLKVL